MRLATSALSSSALRWRWLWQHCLDSHYTTTHSRTFTLRPRTTAARFPTQPRTTPPPPKPTPTPTTPSSRPTPRVFAPSITSPPHSNTAATAATSAQLALIEAERLHQPDTALELLPLIDQQPHPATPQQPNRRWTEQLSSTTAFDAALVEYAQEEQWSSLLVLFYAHPFHHPLSVMTFIPSTAACQLAIEAAMELRDWDKVLRVQVRTVVYQQRRQQSGTDDTVAPVAAATKSNRTTTKRIDRAAAASSASADFRTHACLDCVLYAAYRLSRHDIVLSLFDVRTTPLASSHTTYILSCAQTQQWQRVELWLGGVDEVVWEEVEMAAVHTVMSAWRLALNQHPHASNHHSNQHQHQHQQQQEQHRYTHSLALVTQWMMRVGALSTPPHPVQWSDDFRIQRVADERYAAFPLLVRPMLGYVSPLLVSALSATTHYSEVANMEAVITLTLLRMRSHLLSSPSSSSSTPPALFSLYIQPPHSSLTSWDVDAAVDALGIRGMSAFVHASEMRAVLGGSDKRKREDEKRRQESRQLFESKGERRRRRMEEEAVKRGELDEEKQWVLEIDVETMQRWLDRTMLPWEKELLLTTKQQQQQQQGGHAQ